MTERSYRVEIEKIDAGRKERGWTCSELAWQSGHHPSTIARMYQKKRASMRVISDVAAALEKAPKDLLAPEEDLRPPKARNKRSGRDEERQQRDTSEWQRIERVLEAMIDLDQAIEPRQIAATIATKLALVRAVCVAWCRRGKMRQVAPHTYRFCANS
jgi:lambda repressor-like predicted transcriptional regulator